MKMRVSTRVTFQGGNTMTRGCVRVCWEMVIQLASRVFAYNCRVIISDLCKLGRLGIGSA